MVTKKKGNQFTEKITMYVTKEVADIYRTGKYNHWDVAELCRKAFCESLIKHKDILTRPASEVSESQIESA